MSVYFFEPSHNIFSQLSRCSTARGLFPGYPQEVLLRLRLISLLIEELQLCCTLYLTGPTGTSLALDPLAVLRLDNRLYIWTTAQQPTIFVSSQNLQKILKFKNRCHPFIFMKFAKNSKLLVLFNEKSQNNQKITSNLV